ncbi:MAG: ribosome recycling factor [Halanaerobiaceae bacterium]
MIKIVEQEAEEKMEEILSGVKKEFQSIRTGRARPSLVENIKANNYGTMTPLNQMANIVAPEPRQLVIEPWDKNVIEDIEKAIMKSDLGLTPNSEGSVIRINIPELTEERREELVKLVNEKAEEARISIRNVRREANEELEELEDESEISEDNMHRGLDNIQELTDKYIDKIDELVDKKEEEIMTV